MISKRIEHLRKEFNKFGIDGYVIPKNDEFFSEYSEKNRLKFISNFSGSAGIAIVLKNKNYLFIDSRYTIQAELESSKYFKILDFKKIINCKLFKNLILGIDPKLFTSSQIFKFFKKNNKVKQINTNLIDKLLNKYSQNSKKFFSLSKNIVGESHINKINKVANILKKKN